MNSVWNISKGKDGTMYFGTYKVGVKVLKDGHVIREYSEGLISAFGAGDITYQIRGEV